MAGRREGQAQPQKAGSAPPGDDRPPVPSDLRSRVCQGLGRGPGAAPPERLSHRTSQAVESIQAEDESAKLCKRRIEHLKEHSSDQPAAAGLWKRKRMDRMMVEHLLRCGYYNTAVKLARQSGIEVGGARRGPAGSGQRGRAWCGVACQGCMHVF